MVKIAIQGHSKRGKEVIQILESLGGKNLKKWHGDGDIRDGFFIDNDGNIKFDNLPKGYKLYTLEEFEKEFPFKIGDKVIYDYASNSVGTIVDIKFDDNIPYRVDIKGTICTCGTSMLKPYKEMKEERNITLTLEKAKEWYKKGGELREIALQAFTEKELTKVDLPKTWEEFCGNYPIKEGESYAGDSSEIYTHCKSNGERDSELDRNMCPTPKSAEAHLALIQLEQLRDCYRGLFVTVTGMPVWCIIRHNGILVISPRTWGMNETFLSFQSKEVAEEYLKNFKPLIEKAGDLI